MTVQHHSVKESESNQRLDRFLMRLLPGLTNGQIQKWCRTGQVRINGKRIKADYRVEAGDEVRIPPFQPKTGDERKAGKAPLSKEQKRFIKDLVLHEDDFIIALNKPRRMATQGGPKQTDYIDLYLPALVGENDEAPRLVHRLDKDTSGLLIVAKTLKTAQYLMKAFQQHKIEKTYLAIVKGAPPEDEGVIDAPVLKKPGRDGDRMFIDQKGQSAVTHYRVLDTAQEVSLLELNPKTGRQHQLRVHLEHIGCPIVGDPRYGRDVPFHHHKDVGPGLHLHSAAIALLNPDGRPIHLMAPVPEDIRTTLDFYGMKLPKKWDK